MKTIFLMLSIMLFGCGVEDVSISKEMPTCSLKFNLYDLKFVQLYNDCPFKIDIPLSRERQLWIDGLVCGTHITTQMSRLNGLDMFCTLKATYTENSLELLNNCVLYNETRQFCKYSWLEFSR